jgi:hemerythrin-like domain-containing protein
MSEFFEHLMRAHAGIEQRLHAIEVAEPTAMASALEAFTTFAKQHQDEEETILFPRLRPLPAFAQMLGAFDFQHQMNETEHGAFAACLRAQGAKGDLRRAALRFVEVQRAHMLAEERALFPLAEQTLSPDVLAAMHRELRTPNA